MKREGTEYEAGVQSESCALATVQALQPSKFKPTICLFTLISLLLSNIICLLMYSNKLYIRTVFTEKYHTV
jgi:hypothetical protein